MCCNVFSLALSLFAPQNDDEDDDDEDGDDAEELLGKGARSAALLADRTRVSVAAPRGQITALIWHLDRVSVTKSVNVFVLYQLLGKVSIHCFY